MFDWNSVLEGQGLGAGRGVGGALAMGECCGNSRKMSRRASEIPNGGALHKQQQGSGASQPASPATPRGSALDLVRPTA